MWCFFSGEKHGTAGNSISSFWSPACVCHKTDCCYGRFAAETTDGEGEENAEEDDGVREGKAGGVVVWC